MVIIRCAGCERRHHEPMIFDSQVLQKIENQRHESPEVMRLIAQRDQLLRDHPKLRGYQEEIEGLLATCIDPVMRLEILFMLMTERLSEMRTVFSELARLVHTTGVRE